MSICLVQIINRSPLVVQRIMAKSLSRGGPLHGPFGGVNNVQDKLVYTYTSICILFWEVNTEVFMADIRVKISNRMVSLKST
jgi:prenyltransferase beta subunit